MELHEILAEIEVGNGKVALEVSQYNKGCACLYCVDLLILFAFKIK